MHSIPRLSLALAPLLVTLAPSHASSVLQGSDEPVSVLDYPVLNNPRSDYATFNVEVMRGMSFYGDDALYAINAYSSSLLKFNVSNLDPSIEPLTGVRRLPATEHWRTIHDPVAVVSVPSAGFVYVLGQGSHALAKHDAVTGEILETLQLPSEPADLVLDHNGDAWVSCMGADAVLQVGLAGSSMQVLKSYALEVDADLPGTIVHMPLKRPRFLSYDEKTESVMVAPFLSGNGTLTVRTPNPNYNGFPSAGTNLSMESFWTDPVPAGLNHSVLTPGKIYDGRALSPSPTGPGIIPDNDLMSIPVGGTTVNEVVFDASTLMTAHGRHPRTGAYWMLGVESDNLLADNEPDLNGRFATNELVVVPEMDFPPFGGGALVDAETLVLGTDLDNLNSGGTTPSYESSRSLSFPFALGFGDASVNGGGALQMAAVAASTSPRVALLDLNGDRISTSTTDYEIDLNPQSGQYKGLVPRTVLIEKGFLWVYCQQTGNLLAWGFGPGSVAPWPQPFSLPSFEFSLGSDPSPMAIQNGRALWYDATESLDGRTSCNTCHPGGESDMLGWNLTAKGTDFKGLMVTQPLKGMVDAFPFHWRGERDLIDFNPAFEGLLGGDALEVDPPASPELPFDRAEFAALQDFLFALQPSANPLQAADRRVHRDMVLHNQTRDWRRTGNPADLVKGDPLHGLQIYTNTDPQTTGMKDEKHPKRNCINCHVFPTGSLGVTVTLDNVTHFADEWEENSSLINFIETAQLHNFIGMRRQGIPEQFEFQQGGQNATVYDVPLLGFGFLNSGVHATLADFFSRAFRMELQDAADSAAFVDVFDTGTAPSVHLAYTMDETNAALVGSMVQTNLIDQVDVTLAAHSGQHWVDVVALQFNPTPSPGEHVAYAYSESAGAFVADNGSVNKVLPDFVADAGNGIRTTFLGCMPGQAERLGRDFDADELPNNEEVGGLDPWTYDTDGDGFPDGYEVDLASLGGGVINSQADNDWSEIMAADTVGPTIVDGPTVAFESGSAIKIYFETDEPTRYRLSTMLPVTNALISTEGFAYAKRHSAVIRGLLPSGSQSDNMNNVNDFLRNYTLKLVVWDLADNPTSVDDFQAPPRPFPENLIGSSSAGPGAATELFVLDSRYVLRPTGAAGEFFATIRVEIADAHREMLDLFDDGTTQWSPVLGLFEEGPTGEWIPVALDKVSIPTGPTLPKHQYVSELMLASGEVFDPGEGEPVDHFSNINMLLMDPIDPSISSSKIARFILSGPHIEAEKYAVTIVGIYSTDDGMFPVLGQDAYRLNLTSPKLRLVTGE